ncbi:hypothetical protein RT41_GL001343 [Lactococcus fujiensis JCM 16395]|uniref:Uncharacterized protein n=1 Tax=Lactococcus fujiensis JCM 16395 TaxID=1291764 RepID=A0A2A5RMF0_9LACT|nr:hypothetical protein RT41_GL001343 [Lactococcus fujiensis JCM 16395]
MEKSKNKKAAFAKDENRGTTLIYFVSDDKNLLTGNVCQPS